MRNPKGYATLSHPDHAVKEADTFTCFHCNSIRHVKAKQDPTNIGGLCKTCMQLICENCVNKGTCDPFIEKIERWEQRNESLRSYGTSSPF